jgi:hypothetical protein
MKNSKDITKYSPTRKSHANVKKLNNMIFNNAKYLSVPHGASDNLKKSGQYDKGQFGYDRNKIYSMRSSDNPVLIPSRITDIPSQLARRYNSIDDNELIFEGELMKYKPGMKTMYMSRWC